MAVKSTPKTAAAPATPAVEENPIQQQAIDHLKALALDCLLDSPEPLRIADLGRAVLARLDLPFSEEEAGGLASVVRLILDSDPRFAQSNRQWDLALRMGRTEGDRKKPVERALEDFIAMLGLPASAEKIARLAGALYGRDEGYFTDLIERVTPVRPQFFLTPDERIGITRWLLAVESEDPEDVAFDNFETDAEVAPVEAAAGGVGETPNALEFVRQLAERSPTALPFKPVAFAAWRRFPDLESQALFNDLLNGPDGVRLLPGPVVAGQPLVQQLMQAIRNLVRDQEAAASLLAAAVPAEEEAAPTTVTAAEADIDQIYEFIEREPLRSYRASELCQIVLETFPGSRSYPSIHQSVIEKLKADPRFAWVGNERFRLDGMIPDEVQVLPEGLAFDERVYVNEEKEAIDKLTLPETWKYGLAREVENALLLDVGDDDSQPGPAPQRLRKSLLLHHYFAGTAYVPHAERAFFPREPDLVEIALITPEGERIEAWFNHRLGLLYGLRAWFERLDAQSQLESWSGPVFNLVPAGAPDEFRLEYTGEVEPLTFVARERLPQLFGVLRGEAEAEGWPLTHLVSRILKDYPEGLSFGQLFTQANIVRRVRRDAVASVLSAQRYFTQNAQQPGLLRHDEKRAEKKGKKRGPRRFEDYDEEEEIVEEEE
jgi:hypothetical protein